jgi:hypothetical protein
MVQLNLLPDVKKEFLHAERARRRTIAIAILVTIAAAGLTVLFAFYVYGIQSVVLYTQTQDIQRKSTELKNIKDIDKYLAIQNQLANLSQLHENKINMSRLMDFLPALNPAPPKNVTLNSLDVATAEDTLTLIGKVKDYAGLTTFKDTLVNAEYTYSGQGESDKTRLFSTVAIESAVLEGDMVKFSIVTVYDKNAFLQKTQGVSVKVPSIETTQSVVGSPQPIFEGGDDNGN